MGWPRKLIANGRAAQPVPHQEYGRVLEQRTVHTPIGIAREATVPGFTDVFESFDRLNPEKAVEARAA